jgi:hypothetical protein
MLCSHVWITRRYIAEYGNFRRFLSIETRFYSNMCMCFLWGTNWIYICHVEENRPPLWSSDQSSWLQIGDVLWGTNWIYILVYIYIYIILYVCLCVCVCVCHVGRQVRRMIYLLNEFSRNKSHIKIELSAELDCIALGHDLNSCRKWNDQCRTLMFNLQLHKV